MRGAAAGKAEVTNWLLKNGADPNLKDASGVTALMFAQEAAGVRDDVVRMLEKVTTVGPSDAEEEEQDDEESDDE